MFCEQWAFSVTGVFEIVSIHFKTCFIREEKEGMREDGSRILPILALNEVFIGESLSSRVSYLELQVMRGV